MTEFQVVAEVVNVRVSESEVYPLKVPVMKVNKGYTERIKKAKAEDAIGVLQKILDEMGLPISVQEEHFTIDQLYDLWIHIQGGKKK